MVAECRTNSELLQKVAEVYEWLDAEIRSSRRLAGECCVCGRCCDFAEFDHRLFVTPPELMYLAASSASRNTKPMNAGRCPYNDAGKCTIYEYRFAACRVFCCKGDRDFQNGLSESALARLKSLCTEYGVDYRYLDLATALDGFAGD
ncbi:MAG: YkgJ family cysteine cluster protein [Planctomycetota bacterium]|jgi:hypothetical protein